MGVYAKRRRQAWLGRLSIFGSGAIYPRDQGKKVERHVRVATIAYRDLHI